MNNQLFINIYSILTATWRRRYVIILMVMIMPVLAVIVGVFVPKNYEMISSILIQEPMARNPFLQSNNNRNNDLLRDRSRAFDALIHNRQVLHKIALESEIVSPTMPSRQQEKRLNNLSVQLSVEAVSEDLAQITFKGQDKVMMKRVIRAATLIFAGNLDRAIETLGMGLDQTSAVINGLDRQISTVKAELAALKAHYTSEHSTLQARQRELNNLMEERDKLMRLTTGDQTETLQLAANDVLANSQFLPDNLDLEQIEFSDRIKITYLPTEPTKYLGPGLFLFLVGGVFLGGALGAGLAFLLEISDTSVRRRDRLEQITELPVLSRIPLYDSPV